MNADAKPPCKRCADIDLAWATWDDARAAWAAATAAWDIAQAAFPDAGPHTCEEEGK